MSTIEKNTSSRNNSERPSVWDIYFPPKSDDRVDYIYIASFPLITLFWPTVLVLLLGALLQGAIGISPAAVGWLTILVLTLNMLPLVQEFDQKKFLIFVFGLLTAILLVWILQLYGFSFLQTLASWITSFTPELNTHAYLVLGTSLLLLLIWGLLTPLFSFWKFEQNEFIHYTRPIGKDMSISRLGCTVYKEIPDVIECFLLGGGGSIIIRKDSQVLATIENVPFLKKRMQAIEEMLSETRVVVDPS